MKVVIFGADKLGIDFYFAIRAKEEVVCFVDNSIEKQGKEILGIKILSAEKLPEVFFDRVYIASAKYFIEIELQIKKLGISQNKISLLPVLNDKREKIVNSLIQFYNICNKEKYDNEWKKIKEKYKCIKVYELNIAAIGELITRFVSIMNTCKEDNVLRVFIPETENANVQRVCNRYLIELLGRKIHLMQEDTVAFWTYILKTYAEDIDFSEYNKYKIRNGYPAYKGESDVCDNWFYHSEIEKGDRELEQMGIKEPFAGFAARTDVYNKKTVGHDFDYEYRNMDFDDYEMAMEYLQQRHITAVKMGRMEDPMKEMNNCIDYAGLYADDFRDLYISSKCEFLCTNQTGICCMPGLFGKPILMVNVSNISFGSAGVLYTDRDLYIPKKFYDVHRNRYLSLREIMKVEMQCLIWGERYEERGIRFINNTPEEIAAVTQEMVERLEGTWKDSSEDQKNYERYLEIYQEMKMASESNPDVWTGGPIPYRIAATYLRDNLYLLE